MTIASAGLLFLFVILSGIWLSSTGRPLNTVIFTIHKLIGVAAFGFLIVTVYRMNQTTILTPIELTAAVIAGLFFISTIVTGALLSTEKSMPAIALTLHQLLPALTILSSATTLFILLSRK